MSNHITVNVVRRSALLEITRLLIVGPFYMLWIVVKLFTLGIVALAKISAAVIDGVNDHIVARRAGTTVRELNRRPRTQAAVSNRR